MINFKQLVEILTQTNLQLNTNTELPSGNSLINIIILVASLITALTVIIHFVKKSNDSISERIRREAREIAGEEARIVKELQEQDSKRMEQRGNERLKTIEDKIDKLMEHNIKQSEKQDKMNYLLQQGHIETWKNDIRTIYYNLRDTGNISDVEKSYVDKIYHLYKEMGGNSDIDAKYAEMVAVYTKRLEESYDQAYEKRKAKNK